MNNRAKKIQKNAFYFLCLNILMFTFLRKENRNYSSLWLSKKSSTFAENFQNRQYEK